MAAIAAKYGQEVMKDLLDLVSTRSLAPVVFFYVPPPPLWAAFWPGSGKWNHEEEQCFLDIYGGWESGTHEPWLMKRWKDHLEALAHSIVERHPGRAVPAMDSLMARSWASLFDLVYNIKDETIAICELGPSFHAKKLPLFQ
ncbi:hypothetical protein EV122DRAFT_284165 [Schizophyllum commune]